MTLDDSRGGWGVCEVEHFVEDSREARLDVA